MLRLALAGWQPHGLSVSWFGVSVCWLPRPPAACLTHPTRCLAHTRLSRLPHEQPPAHSHPAARLPPAVYARVRPMVSEQDLLQKGKELPGVLNSSIG